MPTTSVWRRLLAALLTVVTMLAGAGRAAASTVDPADLVAGLHAPICHSGSGASPADPAAPLSHDCCDDCALMALAVLPAPPSVAEPFTPAVAAARDALTVQLASPSRQRSPRQSQGPPHG